MTAAMAFLDRQLKKEDEAPEEQLVKIIATREMMISLLRQRRLQTDIQQQISHLSHLVEAQDAREQVLLHKYEHDRNDTKGKQWVKALFWGATTCMQAAILLLLVALLFMMLPSAKGHPTPTPSLKGVPKAALYDLSRRWSELTLKRAHEAMQDHLHRSWGPRGPSGPYGLSASTTKNWSLLDWTARSPTTPPPSPSPKH